MHIFQIFANYDKNVCTSISISEITSSRTPFKLSLSITLTLMILIYYYHTIQSNYHPHFERLTAIRCILAIFCRVTDFILTSIALQDWAIKEFTSRSTTTDDLRYEHLLYGICESKPSTKYSLSNAERYHTTCFELFKSLENHAELSERSGILSFAGSSLPPIGLRPCPSTLYLLSSATWGLEPEIHKALPIFAWIFWANQSTFDIQLKACANQVQTPYLQ